MRTTLAFVPKAVFGLLAVLVGSSIVLWVLYNELVERQPQYRRPPLVGAFGIGPVMFLVGLAWLRDAWAHLRGRAEPEAPSPATRASDPPEERRAA